MVHKIADKEYPWRHVSSETDVVNLNGVFGYQEYAIAYAWAESRVGRRLDVILDRDIPEEEHAYVGRSYADAPEVDGAVYVTGEDLAPGQIRGLFVVESSLIGLLGGVIGVILGWLLGKTLNVVILEILRWQEVNVQGTFFVVSWWLVVAALAFATLIGLLAGLYPAARAARLAPLDALRYE